MNMNDTKEGLEKSFTMIENSMEKMWDMWIQSLGRFSGNQEQMETMTKKLRDQNKAAREELIKLVEDLSAQTRRNQEQFQKVVEESVTRTYQQINTNTQELMGDLSKRVEDLAKKTEKK